jgi:single-strand DNA-binding protein
MSKALTTISGNLTRDADLRFTQGGTAICTFSVASNYRFQKDGDWEEKVSFFDVTVWGQNGEQVASVLGSNGKGAPVIVSGRLEQQTWEDKEGGGTRSKVVLVADEVGILTRGIDSWERKAPSGNGAPQRSTGRPGNSRQAYSDEEPF